MNRAARRHLAPALRARAAALADALEQRLALPPLLRGGYVAPPVPAGTTIAAVRCEAPKRVG